MGMNIDKIAKLDKLYSEYQQVEKENKELLDKQSDKLLELMEEYKPIAEWHIRKDFIVSLNNLSKFSDKISLAENERKDIIYFWDPKEQEIRAYDQVREVDQLINPRAFVRKGFFKQAVQSILILDEFMEECLSDSKQKNNELETDLAKLGM